jgi:hypothetical protein
MSPDQCRQAHAEMRGDLARSACESNRAVTTYRGQAISMFADFSTLDALRKSVGRALMVELILVRLTILGVSFGPLAFESREMAPNFIGRKHTSHFGHKRGSSLAKAGC